ncbi:MAG TPA: hypothetical protein DCQ92_12460 [Verrucomicrobia subdivision 3 bacterium]|nr:hypothetical protein [Limisphaerales bacterium]
MKKNLPTSKNFPTWQSECAKNNPRPPRTEARQSKIRALTPIQRRSLLRWLNKDKVTYAVARERLLKQFGASLSIPSVSVFWHCHNAPQPPAQDILLDMVIQSAKPVRLIVKRRNSGISLTQKI